MIIESLRKAGLVDGKPFEIGIGQFILLPHHLKSREGVYDSKEALEIRRKKNDGSRKRINHKAISHPKTKTREVIRSRK
jgi:hypothetical protein